ncbi:hypothetical protein I601_3620 [Nocardioides dokdonensis FR1436]|uniref:Uncharacterized protein n=1 Tax=Nocardioides dokdonensis FR1436 TaxID=1300347 RepID=A0A1A9GPM0_9ACTN|nr:hypothetical protein [Nocardioides dokdonensis]ANH40026.1 hypothetical protein I601_3620 [Nocardioides dokdonensis FR1436]
MVSNQWPIRDREWAARYQRSMAGRNVPAAALEERERELLGAVREADVPAARLLGDPDELASEDAAELATVDEAVRRSVGGGLQPALHEAGNVLMGVGLVTSLVLVVRSGWAVDIDLALAAVGASVLVVFLGWVVVRALFASGRTAAAVGAGLGAVALAGADLAYAGDLGAGEVAVRGVPVPLLVLALLTPGVTALVVAHRMSGRELGAEWDDATWLRRFRGGLRGRLVPATTARGHVAEIEQALSVGGMSAYSEFGHPLVLAHELAAADATARTRLWAVSTVAAVGAPLTIAALVLVNQGWGRLTVPVAVVFLLAGVSAAVVGWGRRPWGTR